MIWEAAGVLCLDPGPFTLRQLLTMERRKLQTDFEGPALVASILLNVNRKKGKPAIEPLELNPYYTKAEKRQLKAEAKAANTVRDKKGFLSELATMAGINPVEFERKKKEADKRKGKA